MSLSQSQKKEVFISYSSKDKAFAVRLYESLTRDGVSCFFDKMSITWGKNWVLELEKGIDRCDHILLILSPQFCSSEWTRLEWTSVLATDAGNLHTKLLPLLYEVCDKPKFLNVLQHIDVTTDQTFKKNYPTICEMLGGIYIPPQDEEDQATLPPTRRLPNKYHMPYSSLGNGFVGRVSDLWQINDILRNRKTAIVEGVGLIEGTGGLGKTQLAIEYVHRFGYRYSGGVFWVEADQGIMTVVRIISDNAKIEIDARLSEKEQIALLWKQLNRSGNDVLIVLDNFPEQGELTPYLPVGKTLFTLVTTRRRDLTQYSKIPLKFLSQKEGVDLLSSGDRKFGKEAEGLIEKLAGLPLAIELARNYLNLNQGITIEKLLAHLDRTKSMKTLSKFTQKYSNQLPSGHDKEIAATIQLSWDLASKNCQRLMQCMAILAPTPIPKPLIRIILELSDSNSLEDPLDEAIDEGHNNLSLIELDNDNDPWVHRLISGFVQLTIHDKDELFEKVMDAINSETDRIYDDKDAFAYQKLEKVIPHADYILSLPQVEKVRINILDNLGNYYRTIGIYQTSKKYNMKALQSAENSFEPGHPRIATSQSNLAMVLKDLRNIERAKALLTKALQSYENSYEPKHPRIATIQSNLALILQDLGDLKGAKALLTKTLESNENNFELGHPIIAKSQSNLALVLKDLGDLQGAKELLKKALQSYENSYEPGHPSIARNQSNLALVLQDLGDLKEAKELLTNSLESNENSYEPGHPSIATSQSNLALVLQDLEDLKGAKELLTKALESNENSFELGHPTITTSQSNLALVLKDLGDLKEAKTLLTKALESDENSFEPGHSSIATSQSNLAMVLQGLGDLKGAKELLTKALESDENSFEPGHSSIARSQSNLAMVLQDIGDLKGAKELLTKALESNENSFEPGHPSIARSQSNLAMVLKDLGDLEGAKTLLRKSYQSFLTLFGENHPHTKIVKGNLESIE